MLAERLRIARVDDRWDAVHGRRDSLNRRHPASYAAHVPVVTGELGEDDCAHGCVDQYMAWADSQGISYPGWAWDTWNCKQGTDAD